MDAKIILEPTEAGYRVWEDQRIVGHLLIRVYEGAQRVQNGVLAVPYAIDVTTGRFRTLGMALDYLLLMVGATKEPAP